MKYSEQLKDPRWQRKRLGIFNRDNWRCTKCGDGTQELHVHHNNGYRRGAKAWEYEDDELRTLCHTCHKAEHTPKIPPSLLGPKIVDWPILGAVIAWACFRDEGIEPGQPIAWSGKEIKYDDSERNNCFICCDPWHRELIVDGGCGRAFFFPKNVHIQQSIFFETIDRATVLQPTLDWLDKIQKMTDEGLMEEPE